MKNLIFLTTIILSIVGCQKDGVENQLSFKLEGEQYICNSWGGSNESTFQGHPTLNLGGEFNYNHDGLHPEYLQITLWQFDEIKREYATDPWDGSSFIIFINRNGGTSYVANGPNSGIVIIEELTASYIKGTFECKAISYGPGVLDSIAITEGKFNLNRD
jgi:hypothetical protein